jgi:hypothetical protein
MKVVLRWLNEWLTRMLEGDDYKRRGKLVKQKDGALSIFEETKKKLQVVACDLNEEGHKCDRVISKKKAEIELEETNAKEARDERDRIQATCNKLDELLGVAPLPDKVEEDVGK